MNILLIDPPGPLPAAFKERGHKVEVLSPGGGVYHLATLSRDGFCPDILLQCETLGSRTYLGGLEHAPCPTLFWAIDTHLNLFWQQWYALLFDAVLTPHVSLFASLPAHLRPAETLRFAMFAQRQRWIAHGARRHHLALCARLTRHRPIRSWLVELLRPQGLVVVEGLSSEAMLALYADARVTPNECIANEVNFRLLEASSAGSLVLGPDVGPDQNSLLEPGKEFFIYHDGLELLELVQWTRARPAETERMARAAWLRVQAEHLCLNRVDSLLARQSSFSQKRLGGPAATLALWIALAKQTRNGVLPLNATAHAEEGLRLLRSLTGGAVLPSALRPFLIKTLSQILLLFAEGSGECAAPERVYPLCRDLLAGEAFFGQKTIREAGGAGEDSLEVMAAASAFTLSRGEFGLARAFWIRFAGQGEERLPQSPAELCFAWSAAFRRRSIVADTGFGFDPDKGMLPENALAWLLFALHLDPACRAGAARRCTTLLAEIPSLLSLSVGYLAEHSLAVPDDWRAQLQYGLACLKACRIEAGLSEIAEAREKARSADKERLFLARLNAWRPGGRDWQRTLDSFCGNAPEKS